MLASVNTLRKRDVINHIDELEKKNRNGNAPETAFMSSHTPTQATITNDSKMKECDDKNYFTVKRKSSNNNSTTLSTTTAAASANTAMWRNELEINANSSERQPILRGSDRNNQQKNLFNMLIKSFVHKHWFSDVVDILLRTITVFVFAKLETQTAFKRKIHMEELWLYQNPRMPDIVSPAELLLSVILVPWLTTLIFYYWKKDIKDFRAASWVWTLALCVNGLITTTLKITVGRPRPDFFYRCFPDGIMVLNNQTDPTGTADIFNCTGNIRDINEGRKSFPSGHASFAFASFGFVTLYIASKLHVCNARGRGQTWRLWLSVTPLVVAALVAISRTCDYHHHWQDVLVGSIIGIFSVYTSYRQYYPSLFDINADKPLTRFVQYTDSDGYSTQLLNGSAAHTYQRLGSNERAEDNLKIEQIDNDEANALTLNNT